MSVAIAGAEAVREAMRDYPGVLRGLGLAILVLFPSCGVATCGHAYIPEALFGDAPILVDRKVAPDGTKLSVTLAPERWRVPSRKIWFNIERQGHALDQRSVGNTLLLTPIAIKLLSNDTAAIVDEEGEQMLFDWHDSEGPPPPRHWSLGKLDVAGHDPNLDER